MNWKKVALSCLMLTTVVACTQSGKVLSSGVSSSSQQSNPTSGGGGSSVSSTPLNAGSLSVAPHQNLSAEPMPTATPAPSNSPASSTSNSSSVSIELKSALIMVLNHVSELWIGSAQALQANTITTSPVLSPNLSNVGTVIGSVIANSYKVFSRDQIHALLEANLPEHYETLLADYENWQSTNPTSAAPLSLQQPISMSIQVSSLTLPITRPAHEFFKPNAAIIVSLALNKAFLGDASLAVNSSTKIGLADISTASLIKVSSTSLRVAGGSYEDSLGAIKAIGNLNLITLNESSNTFSVTSVASLTSVSYQSIQAKPVTSAMKSDATAGAVLTSAVIGTHLVVEYLTTANKVSYKLYSMNGVAGTTLACASLVGLFNRTTADCPTILNGGGTLGGGTLGSLDTSLNNTVAVGGTTTGGTTAVSGGNTVVGGTTTSVTGGK